MKSIMVCRAAKAELTQNGLYISSKLYEMSGNWKGLWSAVCDLQA